MILEIVRYGHPALRARGRKIGKVDERIRKLAEDMLETMSDADGVGLAAQQVGAPLQLFVLDAAGFPDRPSQMWIGGREVDPEEYMPMILLNPELEKLGEVEAEIEGCLSFPGISAEVPRPARVRVRAQNLEMEGVEFEASGLLARAVQHEFDHLQGVLFIDRMEPETLGEIQGGLRKLQTAAN